MPKLIDHGSTAQNETANAKDTHIDNGHIDHQLTARVPYKRNNAARERRKNLSARPTVRAREADAKNKSAEADA